MLSKGMGLVETDNSGVCFVVNGLEMSRLAVGSKMATKKPPWCKLGPG